MDETLFSLLRERVDEYLRNLEQLVEAGDDQTVLDVARTEFLRVIAAWYALLELHSPTSKHNLCPWCQRRWCFWPRKGVCTVWRAAHAFFLTSPVKEDGQ